MAVNMFLNINNNAVKGESGHKEHEGEIDVLQWAWGMSQSGTMHTGTGGGSGKVNVQDLAVTKYVDKASPILMLQCCSGKHYPKAVLTVRKAGGENPLKYLIIELEDLLISSINTGGNGDADRLTETVTLNFAKVRVRYQPQGPIGDPEGGEITMGWDIKANAAK